MKLSAHFTLAELTASPTAKARRIDNTPSVAEIVKLQTVCRILLEPVRAHFGRPVKINSGYRGLALNAAIGSKPSSQHVKGEAVDFEVPGVANRVVAEWCRDHLKFGQLILEGASERNPAAGWVHISLPTRGPKNGQVMTARLGSHGMVYSAGLV